MIWSSKPKCWNGDWIRWDWHVSRSAGLQSMLFSRIMCHILCLFPFLLGSLSLSSIASRRESIYNVYPCIGCVCGCNRYVFSTWFVNATVTHWHLFDVFLTCRHWSPRLYWMNPLQLARLGTFQVMANQPTRPRNSRPYNQGLLTIGFP